MAKEAPSPIKTDSIMKEMEMKNAARFTPGPWRAGDSFLTNDGQRAVTQDLPHTAEPKHISFVTCQTEFKRGRGWQSECAERDANARLIAAGPTMYDYIAKKATEGDEDATRIIASIRIA